MPVGRGSGVNNVGMNRLVLAALIALATAAPDWWKGQQSSSGCSRTLTNLSDRK